MKTHIGWGSKQRDFCPCGVWGLAGWYMEALGFMNLKVLQIHPSEFWWQIHYIGMLDCITGDWTQSPVSLLSQVRGGTESSKSLSCGWLHWQPASILWWGPQVASLTHQETPLLLSSQKMARVLAALCQRQGQRLNMHSLPWIIISHKSFSKLGLGHRHLVEMQVLRPTPDLLNQNVRGEVQKFVFFQTLQVLLMPPEVWEALLYLILILSISLISFKHKALPQGRRMARGGKNSGPYWGSTRGYEDSWPYWTEQWQ